MRFLLALMLAAALTGCGVELLATTAIGSKVTAEGASQALESKEYAEERLGSRGATQADQQAMAQIRQAINQFGRATGYYPASLAQLAPNYLANVPKTESGASFQYNPQNGALTHPEASAQSTPAPRGGGGGMGMAGQMTGLGMQQELNSMGQSGTSRAQGYAGQQIGNIQQEHNARQQRALDELGY